MASALRSSFSPLIFVPLPDKTSNKMWKFFCEIYSARGCWSDNKTNNGEIEITRGDFGDQMSTI